MASVICSLLIFTSVATVLGEERHNISLVVMAPFPDGELTKGWARGPSLYPAAVIAAREVNNRSDILPGFNLKLIKVDSGCSVLSKVDISLVRDIYENKDHQVVGIIGPGCSAAALQVSCFTRRTEVSLIHILATATSPLLEDPDRNTTYATISSALLYVQVFIELMTYNQWDHIATLQDVGRIYYRQVHKKFIDNVNGSVIFTGILLPGLGDSLIPLLDALRSSRVRVVMVFAGGNVASQLLCASFHRGMIFPDYQWIFHDRTTAQLIKSVKVNINIACTIDDMEKATEGVVLNQIKLEQEDSDVTLPLFQKTYNDYYEDYLEELHGTDPIDYANSYHDAVWAMALALHNASINGVDLTSYTYNRNNDTKVIAQYLSQVHFDGMSGPIIFRHETRSVQSSINIKQLFAGEEVLIGTFSHNMLQLSPNSSFVADTYYERYASANKGLIVTVLLFAIILTVFTILLHLVHIFYRQSATISKTGHLIFAGCYFLLVFLIIYSMVETFKPYRPYMKIYHYLCNVMMWCIVLGYSLILNTVCAQIWWVYRLFRHFRSHGHLVLRDATVVLFVIFLFIFDLLVCIVWNITNPLIRSFHEIQHTSNEVVVFSFCTCDWTPWILAVVASKGIVMIILTISVILNHRINKRNVRNTRHTLVFVYWMTFLNGIGMPLYFVLRAGRSLDMSFVVLCTVLLSTVILCCLGIFLPPVIDILKRKFAGRGGMQDDTMPTPYGG